MKKAINIRSLRLVINNNLPNNNLPNNNLPNNNLLVQDNLKNIKVCKWDYKNVSIDNFLNVLKLAEKSIMGTNLRNVMVNVSYPDILIFEPNNLPKEYKEHYFPDNNLKVFIGNC